MTTRIIGDGEKLITTVLLNGERLHVRVHEHASGQNVFNAVVDYLGLNEFIYFGLVIIKDGEQQFLDLEEKLNRLAKYAPHLWKDDGSCNSSLVFTVFFKVKYYVENICLLQEQQTRHQYYLQLRKDVLENSIRIHDDTSMILASYALQTELGDYEKTVHGFDYFVPQHYLPAKTIAKLTIPYIKNALPAMHQSHRGLSESQSEIEFLKEAQKLSEYGVLFNRVYKKEFNNKVPFNLGICVRGLVVYEETGPVRNPVCKHPWAKVKKMSFKRNKFIVEADSSNPIHSKMMFYTTNYKRSRYLLTMSSSFFNFQMMMASRLATLPEHLLHEEQVQLPIVPPPSTLDSSRGRDVQDGVTSTPKQPGVPATPNGSAKEPPKPKQRPKPEAKQYTLDLAKKEGSFGFSIVGGIELGGIFVKDVTPGGPAAQSGSIKAGDRIVQINKDSFENVTRREAINTLRNAPEKSKFIMETFGQNLVFEADKSMHTPLAVSVQSLAINQPQIPVVQTDRESEFIRIELPKKENTFGIGFTGGPELGGVYVKSLLPNGSAETDGRVAIGDRIVEVDGIGVEAFSRKKIQEQLKQSPGTSTMVFERYKQIPAAGGLTFIDREKALQSNQNFILITLNKKNDNLGFSITGGLDLGGIFVKYLNPNGPAALDGRLEVGDRVVAVNDISLETATRQKALEIIRTSNSPVALVIEKYVTPPNAVMGNMVDGGVSMVRSDSIKSLPTGRQRQTIGQGIINFSMQHLPGSLGLKEYFKDPKSDVQMQDLNKRTVFVSDLRKINGSFGISLIGGAEVGGIFVKAVQPGGAADLDRRIQKGDKVVEINARKMEGLTRTDAMDWLKATETATLVLERISDVPSQKLQHSSQFSSFDDCCMVEIQRKNRTFGLCLMGGPETRGIFVKNLMNEGAAALNGRINRGDRVLEVNGVSGDGLTAAQMHDVLRQSPNIASILVERVHIAEEIPALDMDTYSVELRKSDSGFGISLTGGVELGGIYVKGILPGGSADSSHKINKGDRLLEVNGVNVEGLSRQQASDQLRKAPQVANFTFEHNAAFDSLILPESEFFTVEIQKKHNGYGLSLTGGPEIDGVYVKQVQRDSSADTDGRIKKGDRIITINGRNVENSTRQQCTEMLKLSQDIVVLHLERCVVGDDLPPLDTVLTVVELVKDENGFGISLTGGPEIGGIFVKALMPGGAAEKDSRIYVGDRVVEMNSVSLDGYTRQQATELLKNSATTATFVLERYKQNKNSMRRHRTGHQSSQLQTLAEESVPTNNHFSFPLYNGAAPSVPPRHQNSGIPSRESAFKRLEQQQQQQLQQQHQQQHNQVNPQQPSQQQPQQQHYGRQHSPQHPDGHQQNAAINSNIPPMTHHQISQHNVQGGPVSSRIPSLMQNSFDREQAHLRSNPLQRPPLQTGNIPPQPSRNVTNIGYAQPNQQIVDNNSQMPANDTIGSLSLIEQPMKRFVNNNDVTEDSPQRFLQQFSKSVITDKNVPPSSRVPLGPISSVIFGNNTGTRGVHEITDIQEDAMPDDVQNLQDDIRDLRKLRDTMYKPTEPPKVNTGASAPTAYSANRNKPHCEYMQQQQDPYSNNARPNISLYPQINSQQQQQHQQHYQQQQQHQQQVQQHNRKVVASPHQTSSLSATPGNMVYTNELRSQSQHDAVAMSHRSMAEQQKRTNYQTYRQQQHFDQPQQHLPQHQQQHQQQQQPQRNSFMQQQQSDPEVIDLDKRLGRVNGQSDNILTSTSEPKKSGGGLQWMSLDDPGNNVPSGISHSTGTSRMGDQNMEQCKQPSSNDKNISVVSTQSNSRTNIPEHDTVLQQNTRRTINNPSDTQTCIDPTSRRQQSRDNRNGSLVNNTQQLRDNSYIPKTGTSSSDIPVPLASRFIQVPHKSPLDGGDYIFEVTLFKGIYGLGMNLAGGGSTDNPVIIKKIATGTAADECGQLNVGDIILEVNGKPVSHLQAKEVISLLRACPLEVQLLAKRSAFDSQYRGTPSATNTYVGL